MTADIEAMIRELEHEADTVLAHPRLTCIVDPSKLKTICVLARLAIEARELIPDLTRASEIWFEEFDALLAPTQREDGK